MSLNRFIVCSAFALVITIGGSACSSVPANPAKGSFPGSVGTENNTGNVVDNDTSWVNNQSGTSDNSSLDLVLKTGDYDKAIEAARMEFNLAHSQNSKEKLADAYIARAWFYKSERLNPYAFNDLQEALRIAPAYYRSQYELGRFHNNQWQFGIAVYYLDKSIALKQDFAPAYAERVYSYYRNQDYTKALDNSAKAIALDPSLAQAYYYRGLVYAATDKPDLALNDLQMAISLSKDDGFTEKIKADLQKLQQGTLYWKPGTG
jgi:tetratricopeptide (TPR) repeat protein